MTLYQDVLMKSKTNNNITILFSSISNDIGKELIKTNFFEIVSFADENLASSSTNGCILKLFESKLFLKIYYNNANRLHMLYYFTEGTNLITNYFHVTQISSSPYAYSYTIRKYNVEEGILISSLAGTINESIIWICKISDFSGNEFYAFTGGLQTGPSALFITDIPDNLINAYSINYLTLRTLDSNQTFVANTMLVQPNGSSFVKYLVKNSINGQILKEGIIQIDGNCYLTKHYHAVKIENR